MLQSKKLIFLIKWFLGKSAVIIHNFKLCFENLQVTRYQAGTAVATVDVQPWNGVKPDPYPGFVIDQDGNSCRNMALTATSRVIVGLNSPANFITACGKWKKYFEYLVFCVLRQSLKINTLRSNWQVDWQRLYKNPN